MAVIDSIQLLRNVGIFDSVGTGANIPLARLTLVYAENGKGKSTLAAVLRSLATGDPVPIAERRRLAAPNDPHAILLRSGGLPAATFENNTWSCVFPHIVVFDDMFVCGNVYSGLAVEPQQRQHLHDLIIGAQGVALNTQLQEQVAAVEAHNSLLREKGAAIPAAIQGNLSPDDFCALSVPPDVDTAILTAERSLAAARQLDAIRDMPAVETIGLPVFEPGAIDHALEDTAPALAAAAHLVNAHLETLGPGGEAWLADGMSRLHPGPQVTLGDCPFCVQDLAGSRIFEHYREFFSDSYDALVRSVASARAAIAETHSGDAVAEFERSMSVIIERRRFWSQFCDIPVITIDSAAIARDWRAARESVLSALDSKLAAPLEPSGLSTEALDAIDAYEVHCHAIANLSDQLRDANVAIQRVKANPQAGELATAAAELERLRAAKARSEPETVALCDDYLATKASKRTGEQERDRTREALDRHRAVAFPTYEASLNRYLEAFNAGFRLSRVASANTRTEPVNRNETPAFGD